MSNEGTISFVSSGRLTWWAVAAQALLTGAAVFLTVFQQMRSAVCDTQCDFETAEAALAAVKIVAMSILVITILLLALLRSRWAKLWPLPLAGVVLTIAAMIVTSQIFIAALPPLPPA